VARPQRTLEKKINGPLGSEGSALKADPSEIQKAYEYLFAMSSISLHNVMILIVTHIPVVTTHNPLVGKVLIANSLHATNPHLPLSNLTSHKLPISYGSSQVPSRAPSQGKTPSLLLLLCLTSSLRKFGEWLWKWKYLKGKSFYSSRYD
jgi:hypothetical protein